MLNPIETGSQDEDPEKERVPAASWGAQHPDPYAGYWHRPSLGSPYPPHVRFNQSSELRFLIRQVEEPNKFIVGALTLLAQAIIAGVVLMSVVIVVLANTVITYDGVVSFIVWGLAATILPAIAVCMAIVLGLPVRLIPAVRRWWIRNGEISVAGVLAGWSLTVYAFLSGKKESGIEEGIHYMTHTPNWAALLWGWCLLAFFITHLWIPARWRRLAQ